MQQLVLMALAVALLNALAFGLVLFADVREQFAQPSTADSVDAIPYGVVTVPDVLTSEECDRLVAHGQASQLTSSTVWDDSSSSGSVHALSADRSSKQTWVQYDHPDVGPIVRKLRNKAAQLTGVYDSNAFEQVQLARYGQGEQYRSHYDSCTGKCPTNKLCRTATLLVYLNDDFQGGATVFDKQGITVRPRKGHAVLFYNVDIRDQAHPELEYSLHAGAPVQGGGHKWIANVWVTCPAKPGDL